MAPSCSANNIRRAGSDHLAGMIWSESGVLCPTGAVQDSSVSLEICIDCYTAASGPCSQCLYQWLSAAFPDPIFRRYDSQTQSRRGNVFGRSYIYALFFMSCADVCILQLWVAQYEAVNVHRRILPSAAAALDACITPARGAARPPGRCISRMLTKDRASAVVALDRMFRALRKYASAIFRDGC